MIKQFRLWLLRRWRWYRHRSLYVVADASDNSITLSRALFDLMDVMSLDEAKVFVFRLCNAATEDVEHTGSIYAFILNPGFAQPTQCADIQYNGKHRTIGFECLCPTVNRIFYEYGLPATTTKVKLSVGQAVLRDGEHRGKAYYIIYPPYAYDKPAA